MVINDIITASYHHRRRHLRHSFLIDRLALRDNAAFIFALSIGAAVHVAFSAIYLR